MTIFDIYKIVGADKNLPAFSQPADLTGAQREILYDGTADYILGHASTVPASYLEWATRRRGGVFYQQPLESYTFGEAVSDFTGEIGNQVVDLNNSINPFSQENRRFFFLTVLGGVLVYFLAPVIIDSLRKAPVATK